VFRSMSWNSWHRLHHNDRRKLEGADLYAAQWLEGPLQTPTRTDGRMWPVPAYALRNL